MSILVNFLKMPNNCDDCIVSCECPVDASCDGYKMEGGRPRYCPLTELPPHGRLIAEKTITEIRYHDADGYHIVNGEQLCELEIDTETVIEAEGSGVTK